MTDPSGNDVTNASGQGYKDHVSQFSDPDLISVMMAFKAIPELPMVQMLTLADVVQYFRENAPKGFEGRGALLKQPRAKGYLITQVFLDEADSLCLDARGRPLGRRFVTESFDDELAAIFGTTDLIIAT